MASRAKAANIKNRWRQIQYLKHGIVMLPDLRTERATVRSMMASESKESKV